MSKVRTRRLYVQLYVVMLGSTLGCLLVVGVAFRMLRAQGGPPSQRLGAAAAAITEARPDLESVDPVGRLGDIADELAVDVVVGDARGSVLATPTRRPFIPPDRPAPGWRRGPTGPVLIVALGADRWAALRLRAGPRRFPLSPFSATLAALAVVMAAASYPIARRLTRRLEGLAEGVERWGRGELSRPVAADGADEVARLAAAFNRAATRVDLLLEQQRQLLANTSHELRSPLARVRMGLELVVEEGDPGRRQQRVEAIRQDILELDGLIEQLLLFARADMRVHQRPFEAVPLRALLESEAARACPAATVTGPAIEVRGDAALLRHMVRNLLENAARHGGGRDVRALVEASPSGVVVAVEDAGPGIADAEVERVFAPFYRGPGQAGPGHGLGLALVRQVARYHDGEARYVARAGGGSRFEVSLPSDPRGANRDASV